MSTNISFTMYALNYLHQNYLAKVKAKVKRF